MIGDEWKKDDLLRALAKASTRESFVDITIVTRRLDDPSKADVDVTSVPTNEFLLLMLGNLKARDDFIRKWSPRIAQEIDSQNRVFSEKSGEESR